MFWCFVRPHCRLEFGVARVRHSKGQYYEFRFSPCHEPAYLQRMWQMMSPVQLNFEEYPLNTWLHGAEGSGGGRWEADWCVMKTIKRVLPIWHIEEWDSQDTTESPPYALLRPQFTSYGAELSGGKDLAIQALSAFVMQGSPRRTFLLLIPPPSCNITWQDEPLMSGQRAEGGFCFGSFTTSSAVGRLYCAFVKATYKTNVPTPSTSFPSFDH